MKTLYALLFMLGFAISSMAQNPGIFIPPYNDAPETVELTTNPVLDIRTSDENILFTTYLTNKNSETITSISFRVVDESTVLVDKHFDNISIATGEAKMVTLKRSNFLSLADNNKEVKLEIYMINGELLTAPIRNTIQLRAHSAGIARVPLFEIFTSSTCGPCNPGNAKLKTVFDDAANHSKFTCIKYQMDWPGSGDPYYTTEGGSRRANYGVTGIPDGYLDGTTRLSLSSSGETSATIQSKLNTSLSAPTSLAISGSYAITGSTLTADVTVSSEFDYGSGYRLFVALIERETTGNKRSNGENEFEYVFMDMMSSKFGENLGGIIDGYTNSFSYDTDVSSSSGTAPFIEEVDDLHVVAFVQNTSSEEVLNSAWILSSTSTINEEPTDLPFNIYPNPASNYATLNFSLTEHEEVRTVVFNTLGEVVFQEIANLDAGAHQKIVATDHLENGLYLVSLEAGNTRTTKELIVNH